MRTQTDLRGIMLSEIRSQTRLRQYDFTYPWNVKNKTRNKQTLKYRERVVARREVCGETGKQGKQIKRHKLSGTGKVSHSATKCSVTAVVRLLVTGAATLSMAEHRVTELSNPYVVHLKLT